MKLSKQTIEMLVELIRNFDPYKSGGRIISRIYSDFLNKNGRLESHNRELFIYELNLKGLFVLIEELTNPQSWIENETYLTTLVQKIDKYLEFDGYQLIIKNKKYIVSKIEMLKVEVENEGKIDFEQAKEMLVEAENKIKKDDYGGSVSDCSTILEGVFADIYNKITKQDLGKGGNLRKDYKKIIELLDLAPSKDLSDGMKGLTSGLISIISGIDILSNGIGKRHRTKYVPDRGQAKLMFNATKTLVDFFYDKLD